MLTTTIVVVTGYVNDINHTDESRNNHYPHSHHGHRSHNGHYSHCHHISDVDPGKKLDVHTCHYDINGNNTNNNIHENSNNYKDTGSGLKNAHLTNARFAKTA